MTFDSTEFASFARRWPLLDRETGFIENMRAEFSRFQAVDRSVSSHVEMENQYDLFLEEVERATGQRFDNPERILPTEPELEFFVSPGEAFKRNLAASRREFHDKVNRIAPPELQKSEEQIRDDMAERLRDIERETAVVARRASKAGFLGLFAGAAGAAFTDPPILATALIALPLHAKVLIGVLSDAAIVTIVEAAIQPRIQEFRREIGLEGGSERAIRNVLAAGGGAAAFSLIMRGGFRGIVALRNRALEIPNPSREIEDSIAGLERLLEQLGDMPQPGKMDLLASTRRELLSTTALARGGEEFPIPIAERGGRAAPEPRPAAVRIVSVNRQGVARVFDTEKDALQTARRMRTPVEVLERDRRFFLLRERPDIQPLRDPNGDVRTFGTRRAAEKFVERTASVDKTAKPVQAGTPAAPSPEGRRWVLVTGATEADLRAMRAAPEIVEFPQRVREPTPAATAEAVNDFAVRMEHGVNEARSGRVMTEEAVPPPPRAATDSPLTAEPREMPLVLREIVDDLDEPASVAPERLESDKTAAALKAGARALAEPEGPVARRVKDPATARAEVKRAMEEVADADSPAALKADIETGQAEVERILKENPDFEVTIDIATEAGETVGVKRRLKDVIDDLDTDDAFNKIFRECVG